MIPAELAKRRIENAAARLQAARELVVHSSDTERYFDWTASHAQTAIERVRAGELAIEWAVIADRDRATVRELESALRALLEAQEAA